MSISIESNKIIQQEEKNIADVAEHTLEIVMGKVRSFTENLTSHRPEKFTENLIQQDGLLSSRRRMSKSRR